MTKAVANRRDGDRDIDLAPVFANTHRLEVLYPFAAPNFFQNDGLFPQPLRRQQPQNGLANHLGGRVAKHAFGSRVPTGNDTVQRLADDGLVGGMNDGLRTARERQGAHQRGAHGQADDGQQYGQGGEDGGVPPPGCQQVLFAGADVHHQRVVVDPRESDQPGPVVKQADRRFIHPLGHHAHVIAPGLAFGNRLANRLGVHGAAKQHRAVLAHHADGARRFDALGVKHTVNTLQLNDHQHQRDITTSALHRGRDGDHPLFVDAPQKGLPNEQATGCRIALGQKIIAVRHVDVLPLPLVRHKTDFPRFRDQAHIEQSVRGFAQLVDLGNEIGAFGGVLVGVVGHPVAGDDEQRLRLLEQAVGLRLHSGGELLQNPGVGAHGVGVLPPGPEPDKTPNANQQPAQKPNDLTVVVCAQTLNQSLPDRFHKAFPAGG